jgi:transcriptional regulator with GAF, ATPase, and Fis domain
MPFPRAFPKERTSGYDLSAELASKDVDDVNGRLNGRDAVTRARESEVRIMTCPRREKTANGLDGASDEVVIEQLESALSIDAEQVPEHELKGSYRRLVLLYQLGAQVCSGTDDRTVFESVISAVKALLNVERIFVATMSRGGLVPRASDGIDLAGATESWPVSTTMLRRVLDDGVAVLTTDAQHEVSYGNLRSVDLNRLRSVMCCPLGGHHDILGLIYADNRVRAGAFTKSDLQFLTALCQFATLALKNARERDRIETDKEMAEARLDALMSGIEGDCRVVGVSAIFLRFLSQVKKAAGSSVPVLLTGETGTGKEVLARYLHDNSPRSGKPFVVLDVSRAPPALVESTLFGHEKGAFTGADQRRIGRFEMAEGGTLFLDEVQDIPLEIQPKFLRVLEQRTFERVGGNEELHTDARIVGACNKDLETCVAAGRFRDDLFYRLQSVTLHIPPLRERPEDVLSLVDHFLRELRTAKVFDPEALDHLKRFSWPGNARQLRSVVEYSVTMSDGPIMGTKDLDPRVLRPVESSGIRRTESVEPLDSVVAQVEKEHIRKAIELTNGNNDEAIRLLGISRDKYYRRKKEFGL